MTADAAGVIRTGPNTAGWDWYDVNMNGMGWTTGVVASADGAVYCKTDVGGVYRLQRGAPLNGRPDSWLPLNDEMGGSLSQYMSIESIAVHPTDGQIVYFAGGNGPGEIFKSADGGDSWVSTNFRPNSVQMAGNGDGRADTGERLSIDPNNTDMVYFASRINGLWRYNGTSWTRLNPAGLPASAGYGYTFVAFDKNGGSTAGGSNIFYVGVTGRGVYRTTDGGANFEQVAGGPVNPASGAVNGVGTVVAASGIGADAGVTGRGVYSAGRTGNFSQLATQDDGYFGVSVDISNDQFVAIGRGNGRNAARITADGTLLWTRAMQNRELIPYAEFNGWCHPERGGFAIDPLDPARGFAGTGFGVVKLVDIGAAHTGTIYCDDYTQGISELCAMYFKIPPNDKDIDVIFGTMDLGHIVVEDRTAVPTIRTMLGNSQLSQGEWNVPLTIGTGLDFCWSYPNYMAYTGSHMFGSHALKYGVSRDGGRTWEEIHIADSAKAGRGIDNVESTSGVLAMSSSNPYNVVWSPDYGGFMKWSDDMGSTWNDPENLNELIAGHGGGRFYERAMYYWGDAQTLQASRVTGDRFYFFTAKNGATAELWRSDDAGKNWKKVYAAGAGGIDAQGGIPWAKLHVNPVVEGDVFVTLGANNGDRGFWRSKNADTDSAAFERITNVQYANALGFGAGSSKYEPWIYIYGRANGDLIDGIYVSKDDCATWEKITQDETEQYYGVTCIGGDMRTRGLVYVSRGGRGIAVGELAGLVEKVDFYDGQWNQGRHPDDTKDNLLTAPEFKLGEEILENGSFVSGTSQWGTYSPAPLNITQTPGAAYGDRYLSVGARGESWNNLYQTIDTGKIVPGIYTVSAWLYLEAPNNIQIGLHFADGVGDRLVSGSATKTGEWIKVEDTVEITAADLENFREIQFVVKAANAANVYRAASLSVKSGGVPAKPDRPQDEELLVNGDFSDSAESWFMWNGTLTAVADTGGTHGGDYYVRAADRSWTYVNFAQGGNADGWQNPVLSPNKPTSKILPGVEYKFSAWVYPETAGSALSLGYEFIRPEANGGSRGFTPVTGKTTTGELNTWVHLEGTRIFTEEELKDAIEFQFAVAEDYRNGAGGNFRVANASLMMLAGTPKPAEQPKLTWKYGDNALKFSDNACKFADLPLEPDGIYDVFIYAKNKDAGLPNGLTSADDLKISPIPGVDGAHLWDAGVNKMSFQYSSASENAAMLLVPGATGTTNDRYNQYTTSDGWEWYKLTFETPEDMTALSMVAAARFSDYWVAEIHVIDRYTGKNIFNGGNHTAADSVPVWGDWGGTVSAANDYIGGGCFCEKCPECGGCLEEVCVCPCIEPGGGIPFGTNLVNGGNFANGLGGWDNVWANGSNILPAHEGKTNVVRVPAGSVLVAHTHEPVSKLEVGKQYILYVTYRTAGMPYRVTSKEGDDFNAPYIAVFNAAWASNWADVEPAASVLLDKSTDGQWVTEHSIFTYTGLTDSWMYDVGWSVMIRVAQAGVDVYIDEVRVEEYTGVIADGGSGGSGECTCGCCYPCACAEPVPGNVFYNANLPAGKTVSGKVPVDETVYDPGDVVTVMGKGKLGNIDGYKFMGWSFRDDGDAPRLSDTFVMGLEDAELYAVWQPAGTNILRNADFSNPDKINNAYWEDSDKNPWNTYTGDDSNISVGDYFGRNAVKLSFNWDAPQYGLYQRFAVGDHPDSAAYPMISGWSNTAANRLSGSVWVYADKDTTFEIKINYWWDMTTAVIQSQNAAAGVWTEIIFDDDTLMPSWNMWEIGIDFRITWENGWDRTVCISDPVLMFGGPPVLPEGPFEVAYGGGMPGVSNLPETSYGHIMGDKVTVNPTVPKAVGYIFLGWSMKSDVTATIGEFFAGTGGVTLYAVWEECDHDYGTYEAVIEAATCKSAGTMGICCSGCGALLGTYETAADPDNCGCEESCNGEECACGCCKPMIVFTCTVKTLTASVGVPQTIAYSYSGPESAKPTFSSSNAGICAVDGDGVLTPIKAGMAIVTVRCGAVTITIVVTVK